MARDLEDTRALGSEDREVVDWSGLGRLLGAETPGTALDSKAGFERLMRALDDRRNRQRRRRRLLAYFLGAAAVIIGLMAMLRLLHR